MPSRNRPTVADYQQQRHTQQQRAYQQERQQLAHMTPADHYHTATDLIAQAASETNYHIAAAYTARAQVHATLALYRP